MASITESIDAWFLGMFRAHADSFNGEELLEWLAPFLDHDEQVSSDAITAQMGEYLVMERVECPNLQSAIINSVDIEVIHDFLFDRFVEARSG